MKSRINLDTDFLLVFANSVNLVLSSGETRSLISSLFLIDSPIDIDCHYYIIECGNID